MSWRISAQYIYSIIRWFVAAVSYLVFVDLSDELLEVFLVEVLSWRGPCSAEFSSISCKPASHSSGRSSRPAFEKCVLYESTKFDERHFGMLCHFGARDLLVG